MNERIRELAEQAGFGLRRDGEIYTSRLEHLPITEDIENFAELIVKQCISMADEFEMDVNRSGLVDKMKEYFGVEE